MSEGVWIVVPGWEKFQHYRDRNPVWIKTYIDLLDRDDYLDLTPGCRAVLHGVWLLTARRRGVVRASSLPRALNMRVTSLQLERLNEAGWVELSASKPLALARARALAVETETEIDIPLTPQSGVRSKRAAGINPRAQGTNPRAVAARTRPARNARRWIDNGLADEIPAERLAGVLADEFGIADDALVADLVAYAGDRGKKTSTKGAG